MTKEQEEAIERLNKLKSRNILYGNRAGMIIEDFKTLQNDIETVLNMLKEKDKEIERLRYIKKSFDYVVQKETEKKDKIIDLITEFLGERDLGYYTKENGGKIMGQYRCYNKADWKQHFEKEINSSEHN